jgi:hypothetical protein
MKFADAHFYWIGAGPLRRADLKKVFFIIITYFFYNVKDPLGI